ncbi:glycosyltransferase family 4 protein [Opitutus sp. ER46]|uniref:glycosyltransferase family 4 protein n=1 Tax=Opitutus sp. ER46 TaxID=2161864 RepID=UPI000D304ED1|nr:glycosyltransferase family 4 protein [Opitutus sp. ER46]PTX97743.1 glycosyltransferase family 1 protein [Opitutus sp. ER46]
MSASCTDDQRPVFLITHEFYPKRGGIATFTEEIARATAKLGYNVEVWAQSAPEQAAKEDWPFQLRRLPLKGSHDLGCQIQLARELIRRRRDLRHATVYLPEPGPMLAMMLLQFFHAFRPHRLVLTFHGSEILKFTSSPVRRALARRLIQHATRISTLTHFTRDLLLSHFPEAREKIFLTPGALRSDFAVVPPRRTARKDKTVVLTVGRLHPRKGQLETLQALQLLPAATRAKLEYWIVGGQSRNGYEAALREAAAKRPDLTVRFFGNIPDDELSDVYERADIFAMTSVNLETSIEGFGLVYIEAAAHGLPVVAHDVGGVSEAVVDGVTGLLVPPHRPVQLAAAFEKLIHDPDLRRRLGDSGRAFAQRNCWKQSAAALFSPEDAVI